MATITAIAEQYGISDRQIRNYLGAIASAHPGQELKIDRQTLTEFAIEQIAEIRAIGPAAYVRRYAPVESQPNPIAPVQPQPEPQPQPATVHELATNPGHELTTQAQPSQPAFTVIDGGRLAPMPVGSMTTAIAQPQALTPIPLVTGQIANTANSAAAATAAARQMVSALRDRLTMGLDAIDQQDLQSRQSITALETELADLETVAAEYQQTARSAQIRENLRAARVGKLTNRLAETGSLAGFQLQPLSS